MPFLKRMLLALITIGSGFVAAMLIGELLLRVAGIEPLPSRYGDPILGGEIPVRLTKTFYFPEYGGKLTIHTNNLGFHRDSDTAIPKGREIYRIGIVGDSQTAGACFNRDNFSNLFELKLNGTSENHKFEVLDAGVGRFSPYQYYLRARRDLLPLHPDHLIVAVYIGNDYMDLVRSDDRPYITIGAHGDFQEHPPQFMIFSDPGSPPSLFETSRLYSLIRSAVGNDLYYQYTRARILSGDFANHGGLIDALEYMIQVKRLANIDLGLTTQSLLQQFWFHTFPESFHEASAINRHVVEMFKQMCEREGIGLTYILIPTKIQIEADDIRPMLDKVTERDRALTADDMRRFEDRVADDASDSCRSLGVAVIDLRAEMLKRRHGRPLYYPRDMHLDAAGNAIVAQVLFENLSAPLNAARDADTRRASRSLAARNRDRRIP